MSLNIILTSIGLGCIVAVLAQTILPLDGEFLTTAAIASAVLLLFTLKVPRLSRPVQGKQIDSRRVCKPYLPSTE